MELGHKLIIWDCGIFSALYDMLNQNYSTVAGRHNCRIALGPHSNPMCAVHEDFRCVVVMTPAQAAAADPSLLNRFEKQWLLPEQLLPPSQQRLLLQPLQQWADQLAAAASFSSSSSSGGGVTGGPIRSGPGAFSASELFLGLHDDTLPSLLMSLTQGSSSSSSSSSQPQQQQQQLASPRAQQALLHQCLQLLSQVVSLDGLARSCVTHSRGTSSSALAGHLNTAAAAIDEESLQQLVQGVLTASRHSIRQFVEGKLQQQQPAAASDPAAAAAAAADLCQQREVNLWYVMTRSAAHTAVTPLLQQLADVTELLLDQIKSETDLRQQVDLFLAAAFCSGPNAGRTTVECSSSSSNVKLLVLHAETATAAAKLRHLRSLVLECLRASGIKAAAPVAPGAAPTAAAAAAGAPSTCQRRSSSSSSSAGAADMTVEWQKAAAAAPMVAICVICHVPVVPAAAAAAVSSRQAPPSAAAPTAAARVAPAGPTAGSSRLVASSAAGRAQGASGADDGWQANYLSSWQLVTVDGLEGVRPWLWQVLCYSLQAAAGLPLSLQLSSSFSVAGP